MFDLLGRGERRSREAVLRWSERLGRLYPGHEFELLDVLVRGAPWDLTIAARLTPRRPRLPRHAGDRGCLPA